MLKKKLEELERKLLSELINFYGDRLITVAIFGSMGRGTFRADSDIDILLIVVDLPKGRMKRVSEFMEIEKRLEPDLLALEKEGIRTELSPVLKTPQEAEAGSPLFLDMVEDARLIYDRHNFFSGILNRLRQRLEELGSQRIWLGDVWYWVLKPDYKAKEEFGL